ncbi:MAG: sigma-54-dependent Fis family transcriptional regulator [Candidatus Hydrogenedentota bacterium]|nr:MAG: sigma-54-dependent Fis family transcriptional regulator [Candidatus Hydrogenedentota bacterium]
MMTKHQILVVEDEDIQRKQLRRALSRPDRNIVEAQSGEEAVKFLGCQRFDLVISDVKMPGISGLELVKRIKSASSHTSLLLITAYASVDSAIEAMKIGVEDYLTKPFGSDELNLVVERIFEKRDLLAENILLREQLESQFSFANIISKNYKMQKIFNTVACVAPTDSTIMIQGETGTGKELLARAIHFGSPRKDRQFVAVDCGALPDTLLESELFGHEKGAFTTATSRRIGKLEYAHGGSLFLDEVGNMSAAMQMKVLRAFEEKRFQRIGSNEPVRVDIRLIAATNVDLHTLVREGKFREDLYYRLKVVPLDVPPLRERLEDIPLLARHFLKVYRDRMGRNVNEITHTAIRKLMTYNWPGNVRELENVIERAVATVTGNCINDGDLPDIGRGEEKAHLATRNLTDVRLPDRLAELEKEYLTELLQRFGGKTELAAEKAGLHLRTFQRKLKNYGIKSEDFK